LAFRCLAITAIRGNGKIRRKIIYSGKYFNINIYAFKVILLILIK